jgi:hypothetical protein
MAEHGFFDEILTNAGNGRQAKRRADAKVKIKFGSLEIEGLANGKHRT